MSESDDPYEILRDHNPVHAEDLPDPASSPEAQVTLERILRKKQEKWLIHALRRRPTYSVVLALFVCGVVGAGAWAWTQRGGERATVGCYQDPAQTARTVIVAIHGSPVSTCLGVWRRGELGTRRPTRLEACVLPSGAIGVFPLGLVDVCQRLGLEPYQRQLGSADIASTRALQDELSTLFLSRGCLTGRQARAIIAGELAKHGLSQWHITLNGRFTALARCASIAVEGATDTVAIVPVPKP